MELPHTELTFDGRFKIEEFENLIDPMIKQTLESCNHVLREGNLTVEKIDEVIESLVIGQKWKNDTRLILFVVLRENIQLSGEIIKMIKDQLRTGASPRHVPSIVIQTPEIPKTKSGKIVELAVRDLVNGKEIKNASALANPESLDFYRNLKV